MLRAASALALGLTATAVAQTPAPGPSQRRLPAVSLLPNNSTLQQVMIPRYDKERRLLAVLRAERMRIVDENNVNGNMVVIEMHRPEGGMRGRIDLQQARFDQNSGLLHGNEKVAIRSDTLQADGTGVVYELATSRGFLLGPADTRFYPRPRATSMTTPVTQPHLPALLAASLALLPVAVTAGPAALEPAELGRIERDARPLAVDAAARDRELVALLARGAAMCTSAEEDLASFLRLAALTTVLADAAGQPAPATPDAGELDPGPGGTRVLSDGGMYFDTAKGVLVYLKNVRLTDSRFDLNCTDELKIFLAKKTAPAAKPGDKTAPEPGAKPEPNKTAAPGDATSAPGGAPEGAKPAASPGASANLLGGDFGDIDRLVATGSVRVVRKDSQGLPVTATADSATYEAGSGDVILSGGFPTVRKGKDYLRALEPGLYIRLYANGDVFAQPGKWETGVSNLNQKQKPANPR